MPDPGEATRARTVGARVALAVAFFLSGASGLVYEIVWSRRLATLVGGTAFATQAVLATFFIGLTLGAATLGRHIARRERAQAARLYALLELGIAAGGLWSDLACAALTGTAARLTDGTEGPRTALVALTLALVACFPATFLMGASFAALARAWQATQDEGDARALLGRAYAANTLGAVVGSVGAAFVAMPWAGVGGTLVCAVAGNGAAAALALGVARAALRHREPAPAVEKPLPLPWRLRAALALSGFAAITFEVLAFRVLAVTLSDTIYTFALAVAAYIAGASLGGWLLGRRHAHTSTLARGAAAALLAAALWVPSLRTAAALAHVLAPGEASFTSRIAGEAAVALLMAAPAAVPTTWLYLSLAADPRAGGAAEGAGVATAWNGIGCALAPVVSAAFVLPRAGTWGLGVLGLACMLAVLLLVGGGKRWLHGAAVAAAAAVMVFTRGGLYAPVTTPGWSVVWTRDGAAATVSIEQSPTGLRRLRTNNNFTEGGDVAGISQTRQGFFPALLAPGARRVLALGVGSGITLAGTVAALPAAHFEAVDLLPEVRTAVRAFAASNGNLADRSNVRLTVGDARTYAAHAAATKRSFDLVVGELFHARQAGTGALYAREHFHNVRRVLAPQGVFCQWVPLHETPLPELRAVVRTFYDVFPQGLALFGSWTVHTPILGLCGAETPLTLAPHELRAWLAADPERRAAAVRAELIPLGTTVAAILADAPTLRRWAGSGAKNTDERPTLELGAPRGGGLRTGLDDTLALVSIWRVPETAITWDDPTERARVATLQSALRGYVIAMDAWSQGSLDAAAHTLEDARAAAPELTFIASAAAALTRLRSETSPR